MEKTVDYKARYYHMAGRFEATLAVLETTAKLMDSATVMLEEMNDNSRAAVKMLRASSEEISNLAQGLQGYTFVDDGEIIF